MFAVPNGGSRNLLEAVNLKRQGVLKGVPDLMLPVPAHGYPGMFIEMKAESGRLSPEQVDFIAFLRLAGYYVVVAYNWLQAKELIEGYLYGTIKREIS